MKEKNNESREGYPGLQKVEEWWARLSPEEKEIMHEFGTIIQAFASGVVANSFSGPGSAEALVGSLLNESMDFWKHVGKRFPKNTAKRRQLN
jgi:hypothetical protein